MWHQLDFVVPPGAEAALFKGGRRSEVGFRKLLAALNTQHGIGLPAQFFGYKESPQGPQADPDAEITVGFGYTPRGLRIVAITGPSCDILSRCAGSIHAALMLAAGTIFPMHSRSGEHSMDLLPFKNRFYINNLGVGNQKKESFWMRASDEIKEGGNWITAAGERIALQIGRGLLRQAVLMGREGDELEGNAGNLLAKSLVDGAPWSETGAEFGRKLGIKVHNVQSHTFVKLDNKRTRLVLCGVEVEMAVKLDGPWFIGRLKQQASGQIIPSTREWVSMEKAA